MHLPSARDKVFHPNDPTQSMFFVVEFGDFLKMSDCEIQEVFAHRNILVVNYPVPTAEFSEESLSRLRDLSSMIEVQGEHLMISSYFATELPGFGRYVVASRP
jgi:predicted membrane-bound dolichyl-phosphate-mannose-protein mannosyltransferase